MAGRKPLPSAIKEASGAFKKDPQRRPAAEPVIKRGFPTVPENVQADPIALDCWNSTCQTLDEMNVLSLADLRVLEAFCLNYSQFLRLSEVVKGANVVALTAAGTPMVAPEANQFHKYADRHLKYLVELGLTPSARTRIKAEKPEEEDPFLDFMKSRMSKN